jgi:hypothetical protein
MQLKKDYSLRCMACLWYETCRESLETAPPDQSSPAYVAELDCFHRA